MRATSITSLLIPVLLLGGPLPGAAETEEPATTAAPTPAAVAPALPVIPGRPHASSFDPHGKLDPETQLGIALQHKAEGRPQEALNTLGMAIVNNPDNARLYAVRGSIQLEQGQVTAALADLEKAVRLDPDDAEALTNRAQAYRQFGRVDQALADLDRAIEINPDLIAARFNRGAMRYGKQDFAGAREDFDHCVAVDPHLPGPYFNRASAKDALGDRPGAIADLERFLEISRNDAWKQQALELLEVWANPEKAKTLEGAEPANPHQ